MVSPALHCWVTTLGTMLVMQTDQFFVAQSHGVKELPVYRASYLLCINIQMLATSVAPASAPFISQLWQADRRDKAKEFALRNLRFGLAVVFCGIATLLTAGDDLFAIWLGPGHFSGYALLAVFSLVMILQTNAFIITTASRATEDEAFAFWSITAGVLKLVFSFLLMRRFGLLGIALGTLVAQVPTNYWYMTYRGLSRLGVSVREYFMSVLLPLACVGAIAFGCGWGSKHALLGFSVVFRLATVVLVCSLVLTFSCWYLVFSHSQRKELLLRVNASADSDGTRPL
jgi:O-antigen/teichoic acid export membrane protein